MLSQFEFSCGVSGWNERIFGDGSGNVQTPPEANLTTAVRRDCGYCIHPFPYYYSDQINHCIGTYEVSLWSESSSCMNTLYSYEYCITGSCINL